MAFKVTCPDCTAVVSVTNDMVGQEAQCASCDATFIVPDPPDPRSRKPRRKPPREEMPSFERRRRYSDDDDEPRPRRRRYRASSGRNPLLVIALVLGVTAVFSIACCGGVYYVLPGEKWHTHQSARGGFSIETPVEFDSDIHILGVKLEPGMQIEGGDLFKRGECYVVVYDDMPPRNQRQERDEQLLNAMVKEMTNGPEVRRLVRDAPITVSGFPGREAEFLFIDGGTYVARIVITDTRFYIAICGGDFVRPGNKAVA